MKRRISQEEAGSAKGKEERENVEELLNNLSKETGVTDEEAAEGLEAALGMEVNGKGEDEGVGEGKIGGDRTRRALGDLEVLTQDAELSGTTLVDARNGFKNLSRLEMLWTVRHRWPAGAMFAFNCYMH